MTREEAVMNINFLKEDYKQLLTEEDTEALDMAIEALKQVTGKLNNPDDSLLTADSEACKEQKSKLDLISRAEAIEVIELVDWYHQNSNKDMVSGANDDEHQAWYKAADVYRALEAVPPADRPRGHWIDMADFEQCSECRGTHLKEVDTYYGKAIWIKTDFCPNCGADMRGDTK